MLSEAAWDATKAKILGSADKFKALVDAANNPSKYYVNDV